MIFLTKQVNVLIFFLSKYGTFHGSLRSDSSLASVAQMSALQLNNFVILYRELLIWSTFWPTNSRSMILEHH